MISKSRYIHGALRSGYATMHNAQCNNSEDNLFLIRCIYIYISLDYYGKGTRSFYILTGDQELELRTDLKLTNHSAQNPLDAHARKGLLRTVHSLE